MWELHSVKNILERESGQSKDSEQGLLFVRWRKKGRKFGDKWSINRVIKWHLKKRADLEHVLLGGHDKYFIKL